MPPGSSPAEPTRLFFDAQSNAEWREKGFYPVLNERAMTPEANREASVLYRLLRLKRSIRMPTGGVLPADRFDFSAESLAAVSCRSRRWRASSEAFPQWGMPFGLPALSAREHRHAHALDRGGRAVPRSAAAAGCLREARSRTGSAS